MKVMALDDIPTAISQLMALERVYGLLHHCKNKHLVLTGIGLRSYIRLLDETLMVSSLDELRTYRPYR